MPASRPVVSVLLRELGDFSLLSFKAGPAGGLRPPSSPAATRRHRGTGPRPPTRGSQSSRERNSLALKALCATPTHHPSTVVLRAASRPPMSVRSSMPPSHQCHLDPLAGLLSIEIVLR
jgi:hypothetical protein